MHNLKKYLVEYTEDYGASYHRIVVEAKSFTDAYVMVDLKLSKDGAITDLFEI